MIDIPLGEALKRSNQNKNSRWPNRDGENRLEPECWPALNPKFQLNPGSSIFTIGSCFASHIEHYLHQFGFHLPTIEYLASSGERVGSEILNKYTPPSIYQDLAWTKKIRDRDDSVRMTDIDDFLITLDNGGVRDLQRQFASSVGVTPERALADRRHFYQLFRRIFECETVIITLGFVECWWDAKIHQYVLFDGSFRRLGGDRFFFRRLNFSESYKFIKDSAEIIDSEGSKNILITTSPVPITRTFTSDDVITANSYSKSVLRAVAGQIAEECQNVDYFPSYENVMQTKQSYVWESDLAHVQESFIGRIMLRVTEKYVAGENGHSFNDQILQMRNRAVAGDWGEAHDIYARLTASEVENLDCVSHSIAAQICLQCGNSSNAAFHADRALHLAETAGELGLFVYFECWEIFEAVGDLDKAEMALSHLRERGKQNTVHFEWLIHSEMQKPDREPRLRLLSKFIADELPEEVSLIICVASIYRKQRMFGEAETLVRHLLERQPSNLDCLTMLFDIMLKADKQVAAWQILDQVMRIDPEDGNAEALTRLWLEKEAFSNLESSSMLLNVLIKYEKKGKIEQILRRFLLPDETDFTGLQRLGEMAVGLGQHAVTERICRWVLARAPNEIWAAVGLAKTLQEMGKIEEAAS